MRAIENNPEGAIYTTPIAKCKTRKTTDREKFYIEENWEELEKQVTKRGRNMILRNILIIFFSLFFISVAFCIVFERGIHIIERGMNIICSIILILFSVLVCFASCEKIKTAKGLLRIVKRKEYEVTTFVCRGVYTAGRGSGQIYSLETETGQHIRYSCSVGLWNIDYKDEGFIITEKGAVVLLPIDKSAWG